MIDIRDNTVIPPTGQTRPNITVVMLYKQLVWIRYIMDMNDVYFTYTYLKQCTHSIHIIMYLLKLYKLNWMT